MSLAREASNLTGSHVTFNTIDLELSEDLIRNHFTQYGDISSFVLHTDASKKSKGRGYFCFTDPMSYSQLAAAPSKHIITNENGIQSIVVVTVQGTDEGNKVVNEDNYVAFLVNFGKEKIFTLEDFQKKIGRLDGIINIFFSKSVVPKCQANYAILQFQTHDKAIKCADNIRKHFPNIHPVGSWKFN